MSFPTGGSTGDAASLGQMVNDANHAVNTGVTQNYAPAAPASFPYPSLTTTSATTAQVDETTERRIRDLMSAKDKAIRDASLAQQRAIELERQMAEQNQANASVLEGATRATEQLIQSKAQLEAERTRLQAENLKLAKLAQHPDLLPFAEFIPASSDEATLQAAIEKFQSARQADLQRAQAAMQPVSPAPAISPQLPDLRGIYPANSPVAVPPIQPAAAAQPTAQQSLTDFQARVSNHSLIDDPAKRANEFDRLVVEAEAMARSQYGVS